MRRLFSPMYVPGATSWLRRPSPLDATTEEGYDEQSEGFRAEMVRLVGDRQEADEPDPQPDKE